MSISETKTTRRTCDRCSEWIEYTNRAELDVTQGWKTFGGDDLCPKCADELVIWWNDPHLDGLGPSPSGVCSAHRISEADPACETCFPPGHIDGSPSQSEGGLADA